MSLHSNQCCVISGEATNTNFIVFGLTRTGLEPTIYRTRDDQANHYATDAVLDFIVFLLTCGISSIVVQ
jgi:hypothetical protein